MAGTMASAARTRPVLILDTAGLRFAHGVLRLERRLDTVRPAEIDFAFLADLGLTILRRLIVRRLMAWQAGWTMWLSRCRCRVNSTCRLPIRSHAISRGLSMDRSGNNRPVVG